jgi:hypothetical protein
MRTVNVKVVYHGNYGTGKNRFKQVTCFLPETWEEKAKELGAFRRARGIKTPEELLHLILLYLSKGKSFAGTSALLHLLGEASLNKTAVRNRIAAPGLGGSVSRSIYKPVYWSKNQSVCTTGTYYL